MRSRLAVKYVAAILAIVAMTGCAKFAAVQAPEVVGAPASAPAPILRTVMWSSLFCDVGDPEWRMKMKALHDMNIHGASALLMLCRPQFCEYAWEVVSGTGAQGSSDATYDLMRMNQRWLAHVSDVVDYANSFEPPFALQFDYLPHPTLRSDEHMVFKALRMLLSPVRLMEPPPEPASEEIYDEMVFKPMRNVQGIKANGTELFEQTPTGAWAEVSRNWLRQTVPIINRARFGAVLFVLERTGSEACERWYWNEAKVAGLSPSVYVITNARMSGAIHSPHPHSVSAVRSSGNSYISSDGWNPTAGQWRQCVDFKASRWAPAIELYRSEFSDGSGGGSYASRTRPSAGYIARTCGPVLEEAGR